MMQTVTVEEAKASLLDLIEQANRGVEIVILKDDQPVAKLTGVNGITGRRKFGSAKGSISMSDDFDAPLDDFKNYVP